MLHAAKTVDRLRRENKRIRYIIQTIFELKIHTSKVIFNIQWMKKMHRKYWLLKNGDAKCQKMGYGDDTGHYKERLDNDNKPQIGNLTWKLGLKNVLNSGTLIAFTMELKYDLIFTRRNQFSEAFFRKVESRDAARLCININVVKTVPDLANS